MALLARGQPPAGQSVWQAGGQPSGPTMSAPEVYGGLLLAFFLALLAAVIIASIWGDDEMP